MDHFEFVYYNRDGEVTRFEQDVESYNYNICTVQRLCKRFALAIGYSPAVVDETFGEDLLDDQY